MTTKKTNEEVSRVKWTEKELVDSNTRVSDVLDELLRKTKQLKSNNRGQA